MEDMYGEWSVQLEHQDESLSKGAFWMGLLNRILSAVAQLKRKLKHGALSIFWASLLLVFFQSQMLQAQPYIDPFQVRYTSAANSNGGGATPFTHLWAGCDLPIKLKENSYLILSPTYEKWQLDLNNEESIYPAVQSFSFPVGLILPFKNSKWSLTLIPVLRWNAEQMFGNNSFQVGNVALVAYARKPQQKFRFGVYTSTEFFGLFIVPLVGTDWRIDDKNYLFGALPGRLTFEHKLSAKWYGGATFRAPTNSYRLNNGQFIRLDDNQISLYADYYPAKNLCVTLEPGLGVMRRLRTGADQSSYLSKVNWGDGFFIKLSTAYRIRF